MLPIALTVTLYIAEDECNVMLYFMEEVAYPLMKKINGNTFARGMLHASTKSSMKRSGIAQDSIQSQLNIQLPICQIFFRVLLLCCIDNFVIYRLILQFVFLICLRFSLNFKFLVLCQCLCSSEF